MACHGSMVRRPGSETRSATFCALGLSTHTLRGSQPSAPGNAPSKSLSSSIWASSSDEVWIVRAPSSSASSPPLGAPRTGDQCIEIPSRASGPIASSNVYKVSQKALSEEGLAAAPSSTVFFVGTIDSGGGQCACSPVLDDSSEVAGVTTGTSSLDGLVGGVKTVSSTKRSSGDPSRSDGRGSSSRSTSPATSSRLRSSSLAAMAIGGETSVTMRSASKYAMRAWSTSRRAAWSSTGRAAVSAIRWMRWRAARSLTK
mmetsp:Transcript_2360/g.9039  ORF Transcript_2360/g.9039 Transcript_2360/m.9039 type:complete len:257 (-) Transcript_2360:458-1228(-)